MSIKFPIFQGKGCIVYNCFAAIIDIRLSIDCLEAKTKKNGCHILGNPASELIVIASIAMKKEFTFGELREIVCPHPMAGGLYTVVFRKL